MANNKFTPQDALRFANKMGINLRYEYFNLDDLTYGINVELEHGKVDPQTNVTNNDLIATGKIALAHLREFPDYYRRLKKMEKKGEAFWEGKPKRRTVPTGRKRYRLVRD